MRPDFRTRLLDGIFCTCASAAMSAAIFSGFVLEDALSGSALLTILAAAALTALLLVFSLNRKATAAGVVLGVLALAAAVIYIQNGHPMQDETASSLFLAVFILICTTVLVFLLARTTAGCIALFAVGVIVQAGCQFLQFPAPAWGFVLFLAAAALLFLFRRSSSGVKKAAVGGLRPAGTAVQAAALCLLALLAACGVFYAVVQPLNPPTQELRLITQLKSMDLLQVLGVSTTREVLDENLLSDELPEEEEQGDEAGDEEDEDAMNAPEEAEPEETEADEAPAEEDSLDMEIYTAVSYESSQISPLWLLLLIPVLLAAAVALRVYLRRRRRAKLQALPPAQAAAGYYRFFLRRLKRAGLDRPPVHTLQQFAAENAGVLATFTAGDADFASLTAIYQAVLYGEEPVSEPELQLFEQFYDGFYPALRRQMGLPKYLLFWFSL